VEGCHTLPSSHPSYPLTKYFYYPGFTERTGGLLVEAELLKQRADFQREPGTAAAFLAELGVTAAEAAAFKTTLFCYPQAPVANLFQAWQTGNAPITCLVPEGVATDTVQAFLGGEAKAGTSATRGALTVRVLPFVPQPDYDKLLWSCDFNLVRGEDSFVRAQWTGSPFVWHIYPQDKNLHHTKLNAFLSTYTPGSAALSAFSHAWNGVPSLEAAAGLDWAALWQDLHAVLPEIAAATANWEQKMLGNGDMASNLLKFALAKR
jgi:uncharacterized repeat protein (TIGR03837 family)